MMDFFGPGVEASERIGLYPRLAAVAYHVEAVEYVDAELRPTARLDYDQFARLAGEKVLSLLRPDMERAALTALEDFPSGRVRVRYAARVSGAWADDDSAGVAVDASAEPVPGTDLLIGADGVHSEVRAHVFGREKDYLRPLGMRAAAFIVADPGLNARFANRFLLTDTLDRIAGLYSLRTDEVAAFLVYRDANRAQGDGQPQSARERLRREFAGLGDAVDRLLELCPEHPYDDVVAQIVMPAWHKGRAILIGDACGAVSLLAGQGGSLAIAGAALLGTSSGLWTLRPGSTRPWPSSNGAGGRSWRKHRPRGGARRRRSFPRTGPSDSCAAGSYGDAPARHRSAGGPPDRGQDRKVTTNLRPHRHG